MRVGTRWTPAVLAAVVALATRAAAHVHGHHGDEHRHRHHSSFDVVGFGRTKIYAMAVGASLVTACASLVCVALVPLLASTKGSSSSSSSSTPTSKRRSTRNRKDASWAAPSQGLVRTLSAFAVGAFLGDAFLHQLPHAYAHAATSRGGDGGGGFASELWSNRAGLAAVVGIVAFHLVERAVDARHGSRGSHGGHGHGSHGRRTVARRKKDDDICGEEERIEPKDQTQRKETLGYLNLVADAVHNFTDGAAVGAAFLAGGPAAGYAKTLAMLAHEVPQEIGDFGVLVSAGFSVFDALRLNFAAASTAVAGTLVALVLCDDSGHGGRYKPTWIDGACVEGFTAGGFVYVAAATMRGIGDGEGGWRDVAATTGAIFFGTFACAAIHSFGACDHGH